MNKKPLNRRRLVVLTLLLAAVGALSASVFPRAPELAQLWDDLNIEVQRPLYQEQRRLLALHLPALFPVSFTCLLTEEKGAWRTVLPGDLVTTAREGATLRCTNGDQFTFEPRTHARLWSRRAGLSFWELERGVLHGQIKKQSIRLRAGADAIDLRPRANTLFTATASSGTPTLRCEAGEAQVAASRRMNGPWRLETGDCQLQVVRNGEAAKFTLPAAERALIADLPLGPDALPQLDRGGPPATERWEQEPYALRLSLVKTAPVGKTWLLASSRSPQEDCRLFRYGPGEEPREVHTYAQLEKRIVAEIPPGTEPPFFISCQGGGTTHTSRFLLSVARPEAEAPPPAAPAPAAATPAVAAAAPVPTPAPLPTKAQKGPPAKLRPRAP